MITKAQALTAHEFHHGNCTRAIGKRGAIKESITRARRNGRTQTWKRTPERWRVPIKMGLYGYADITPERANEWHTPEDCPLIHVEGSVQSIAHHTRVQPVTIPCFREELYRGVCTCKWYSPEFFTPQQAQGAIDSHARSIGLADGSVRGNA